MYPGANRQPAVPPSEIDSRFAEIVAHNPDLAGLTDRALAEAAMDPEVREAYQQNTGNQNTPERAFTGFLGVLNRKSLVPDLATDAVTGVETLRLSHEASCAVHIEKLSPEEQARLITETTAYIAHTRDQFVLAS